MNGFHELQFTFTKNCESWSYQKMLTCKFSICFVALLSTLGPHDLYNNTYTSFTSHYQYNPHLCAHVCFSNMFNLYPYKANQLTQSWIREILRITMLAQKHSISEFSCGPLVLHFIDNIGLEVFVHKLSSNHILVAHQIVECCGHKLLDFHTPLKNLKPTSVVTKGLRLVQDSREPMLT